MIRQPEPPSDPLEQRVLRALRGLPRERASDGFTARVLRRLDEPRRPRPAPRFRLRPAAAGGAVAALAAALVAAVVGLQPAPTGPVRIEPARPEPAYSGPAPQAARRAAVSDARALLEELRREHRLLEREIDAFGDLAAGEAPVIYLGGDETLDLVLDLGRDPAPGTVQPANYRDPAPRR